MFEVGLGLGFWICRKGVHVEEPVKGFFCDASLGKVVRYLRALGVDCLHEKGLTADASMLFQQCRESSRKYIWPLLCF